ncbi:MAG: hypothetical protein AB1458_08085 [Bacteroidota bacterium]
MTICTKILLSCSFGLLTFVTAAAQQTNQQGQNGSSVTYTDEQIQQMKLEKEKNNPNSYENQQSSTQKQANTGNQKAITPAAAKKEETSVNPKN